MFYISELILPRKFVTILRWGSYFRNKDGFGELHPESLSFEGNCVQNNIKSLGI